MPISKGVVTAIGSGNVHANNSSTFVEREYVDIGTKHLRKVFLHQYVDDLLQSAQASGDTVEISTYRWPGLSRHNVCAIRASNGTVRSSETFFSMLLLAMVFAPILGALVAIVVGLGLSFVLDVDTAVMVGIACGAIYAAFGIVGYLRARFAF